MKPSERAPVEVWRLIAAHIIDQYDLFISDFPHVPDRIRLNANNIQDILNLEMVSKTFQEGVRLGFREGFSGHVTIGACDTPVPDLISIRLASRIRKLYFNEWPFASLADIFPLYKDLNEALLSGAYPNLESLSFRSFDVEDVDAQECLDGVHNDKILKKGADVRRHVIRHGLSAIDKFESFKVYAIIRIGDPDDIVAEVELTEQPEILTVRVAPWNPLNYAVGMTHRQFERLSFNATENGEFENSSSMREHDLPEDEWTSTYLTYED